MISSVSSKLVICAVSLALLAGCGGSDDSGEDRGATPRTADKPSSSAPSEQADMRVVPGVGIAGVDIDDSLEQVEDAIGEPDERTTSRNEFSGGTDTTLVYDDPDLRVIVAEAVNQVESTDPDARTADGVGIGSSTDEVKDAFPEISCDGTEIVVCSVGERTAGEVSTDFMLEDDEVVRVVVGRLLE